MGKILFVIFITLICILFLLVGIVVGKYSKDYENIQIKAPSDFLNKSDIHIYQNKVIINVNDTRIVSYANSGSMIPTLNENANGIEMPIDNESQIKIGDIITYEYVQCNDSDSCPPYQLIVHRVVGKGKDNDGSYYLLKGDNNVDVDPKVRFYQIKYKTLMIIY